MPIPGILLTPVDASPLNTPVASGATTFDAILATVGKTVLAKKKMQARQEIPHFYFEQNLLFTNAYIDSCFISN